jgi:hypothetical protein
MLGRQRGRVSVPRGALPTYVTDHEVVLCKAAPYVRDTYEARLCLFLARKQGLRFVLSVKPGAEVDATLRATLQEHGAAVAATTRDSFPVSVGSADAEGRTQDVWVLGHDDTLGNLRRLVASPWLAEAFMAGAVFEGDTLVRLREALVGARFAITNVDNEDVRTALLRLVDSAERADGTVFVQ